jgi:hypothetical protein
MTLRIHSQGGRDSRAATIAVKVASEPPLWSVPQAASVTDHLDQPPHGVVLDRRRSGGRAVDAGVAVRQRREIVADGGRRNASAGHVAEEAPRRGNDAGREHHPLEFPEDIGERRWCERERIGGVWRAEVEECGPGRVRREVLRGKSRQSLEPALDLLRRRVEPPGLDFERIEPPFERLDLGHGVSSMERGRAGGRTIAEQAPAIQMSWTQDAPRARLTGVP